MPYVTRAPRPVLAGMVDWLWFASVAPPYPRERVLPTGTLELVVYLDQDQIQVIEPAGVRRYPGAIVSGALTSWFGLDPPERASILGVHFKPGGAYPFLGMPAFELADAHVDLETLWGRRARILRERLCAAPLADKFTVMEDALVECLARPARRHPVVPFALGELSRPDVAVGAVARQAQLSHRRLAELFRAEVGMTPKTFSRVRRFELAVARARRAGPPPDWANVALDCGYFDQSHMIRDFVEFSGLTPLEIFRRASWANRGHCVG